MGHFRSFSHGFDISCCCWWLPIMGTLGFHQNQGWSQRRGTSKSKDSTLTKKHAFPAIGWNNPENGLINLDKWCHNSPLMLYMYICMEVSWIGGYIETMGFNTNSWSDFGTHILRKNISPFEIHPLPIFCLFFNVPKSQLETQLFEGVILQAKYLGVANHNFLRLFGMVWGIGHPTHFMLLIASKEWSLVLQCCILPVVPHKAVAEVSKIGNL